MYCNILNVSKHIGRSFFVCGRVTWLYQYWPRGFMVFVVLCPGTPEGSTGSCSDFTCKASQKTGQRLKVSSYRLGAVGIFGVLHVHISYDISQINNNIIHAIN